MKEGCVRTPASDLEPSSRVNKFNLEQMRCPDRSDLLTEIRRHAASGVKGLDPTLRAMAGHPIRPPEDFLTFGAPYIGEEEIQEVVDTLRSGWLGTGPRVARFESDFAEYKHVDHAVAVSSCTAALHLSMVAARLPADAEVVTTPLTFCATVNAILHAGARPVLADIDPKTMNLDPEDVKRKVTDKTAAILPVHFAGRPCDMDALTSIAREHGLLIIEDCAHAIETEYHGQPAGTIGDFGCFSFYATKNVVTGEGGMVLSRDPELAARIKVLALHGMSKDAWHRFGDDGYRHYFVGEAGFKYNMTDIQAALGIHQLARVESMWERRQHVWNRYLEELADLPLQLPSPPDIDTRHGLHLFTALVRKNSPVSRDVLLGRLNALGIGSGVHYLAVPEHPYYQEHLGWRPEDVPFATDIGRRTISLPLSGSLSTQDVSDVVDALRRALR